MLGWLVQTHGDVVPLVLQLTPAFVMFPHRARKALGWLGGYGFKGTMGGPVMRISLPLGLALVLMAGAAWGQRPGQPANGSFRVSWEPRTTGVIPTIEGHVRNDSAVWVTDVRLQVVGLDADGHRVGERMAWALGDIAPGGESSFVTESVPGAVSNRITVVSFAVVSVVQAP